MRRVALLGVALLLAGCGGGNGPTAEGFVPGLEAQGVKPAAAQSEPPGVLEVPSTAYEVPGGTLHVFTFPDEQSAKAGAARVQPDGYTVQTTMGINQAVDWAAPPHWYRQGKEVAVYLGKSQQVLDALEQAAGPQFAGA
jgi:hypothetical protein